MPPWPASACQRTTAALSPTSPRRDGHSPGGRSSRPRCAGRPSSSAPPAARTSTTGSLPPSRRHRWRASCWDTSPQGTLGLFIRSDPPSASTSPAAYRCTGYAAGASRKPFSAQVSHLRRCYRSSGVLECSSTKCSGFSGVPGPVVLLASGLVFQAGDLRGNAHVDDCIAVAAGMSALRDGQKKAAGSPSAFSSGLFMRCTRRIRAAFPGLVR